MNTYNIYLIWILFLARAMKFLSQESKLKYLSCRSVLKEIGKAGQAGQGISTALHTRRYSN